MQPSFLFTNAGASGRNGPSASQLFAEYNGTNSKAKSPPARTPVIDGLFRNRYLRIEATGAGVVSTQIPQFGRGTCSGGEFNLTAGQVLTIVVGQAGGDNPTYDGHGRWRWYFRLSDNNDTLSLPVAEAAKEATRTQTPSAPRAEETDTQRTWRNEWN